MTKDETLLLYKDLCSRTTCGTKIKHDHGVFTFDDSHCGIGLIDIETSPKIILSGCYYGDNIKPYLFPMSSMTEEQREKYESLCETSYSRHYDCGPIAYNTKFHDTVESIDYLIENHFDYRGLIPMGLALDATGLNIY